MKYSTSFKGSNTSGLVPSTAHLENGSTTSHFWEREQPVWFPWFIEAVESDFLAPPLCYRFRSTLVASRRRRRWPQYHTVASGALTHQIYNRFTRSQGVSSKKVFGISKTKRPFGAWYIPKGRECVFFQSEAAQVRLSNRVSRHGRILPFSEVGKVAKWRNGKI